MATVKNWNRTNMIDYMSKKTKLSKRQTEYALNAFLDGVRESLKKGTPVRLIPFGSFEIRHRKARTGRNPRTGEKINIKARRVPIFRPGKSLKKAV